MDRLPEGANLHVCQDHYRAEMDGRARRILDMGLGKDAWDFPDWFLLDVAAPRISPDGP